jgi:hypothetical protein
LSRHPLHRHTFRFVNPSSIHRFHNTFFFWPGHPWTSSLSSFSGHRGPARRHPWPCPRAVARGPAQPRSAPLAAPLHAVAPVSYGRSAMVVATVRAPARSHAWARVMPARLQPARPFRGPSPSREHSSSRLPLPRSRGRTRTRRATANEEDNGIYEIATRSFIPRRLFVLSPI